MYSYFSAHSWLCYSIILFLITTATIAAETTDDLLQQKCQQCHALSGSAPKTVHDLWNRKGPDLFYAGNKYKKEWMTQWLQNPKQIRPAGMFYGNHIKQGKENDVVDTATLPKHPKLSAQQSELVTNALMKKKKLSHLIEKETYTPGNISVSMGEMMFDKFRGCLACHQIEPNYGGLSGPEVYTAATRLQEKFILSYMRSPQAWDPVIFMPNKHLKEKDLQKFVHYFRVLSKENFD